MAHAYQGPGIIAPEEVAALSRAVTLSSCSGWSSVDKLFASADISSDAEEDQG